MLHSPIEMSYAHPKPRELGATVEMWEMLVTMKFSQISLSVFIAQDCVMKCYYQRMMPVNFEALEKVST